ncbi:MAG: hypothetical protein RLN60_02645 [Phycisphaerales bacterium]
MPLQPIDMLRRLASGVTPDGRRAKRASAPFESRSFADLLTESSRPVRPTGRAILEHAELDEEFELDEDERERLSFALDRAEAQFMESLLAISSAGVLVVDVNERTIRRAEDAPDDELFTGIDGAVVIGGLNPKETDTAERAEHMARRLRTLGSASLLRVLSQEPTERDTPAANAAH